jgi:Cytidylyltransferase family
VNDSSVLPSSNTVPQAAAPADHRRRTAAIIFRSALACNGALTVFWLATFLSGGSFFFDDYRVDLETAGRIFSGILFFYVIWGVIWWAIKAALLRWFVGFTRDERRDAFSSRMDRPYDVGDLVSRYSERRIRITDMIGRRGRFITLAAAGMYYLYLQVAQQQNDDFATAFLQDNLLDAVVTQWIFLGFYHVNGLLGAFFYGPQSRVMDGVLARANCLLITTLWTLFKFVMVPIGVQLAAVYPKEEFGAVFVLLWGSYIVTDASAEIVGSLFGRQRIRVRGIGDVNRKSVAGIVGGFAAALIFCVWVVVAHGLGTPWLILALVLAISNTLLELYSPRGTDDFTMATANALICWAFGAWLR